MRAILWAFVLVSVSWMGCALNSEGKGEPLAPGRDAGSAGAVDGSGGTGGLGGVGGGGGTGGATGGENCVNGVHDNEDNLADCEDPQCKPDYVCVPEPPSGWSAVGYQNARSFPAPATDCGPLKPSGLALHDELTAPDAGCACGCETPTGGSCAGPAVIRQYSDCTGFVATVIAGCFDFPNTWTVGGVKLDTSTVVAPGSCAPSATGTPDEARWSTAVDLCLAGDVGTGCAAGSVCVAKSTGRLEPAACIEQAGDVDCPAAYPAQHVYYEGIHDARTCSATQCSCSEANGQTCRGALYDNDSCSGQPAGTYSVDGTCHATGFDSGDVKSGQLFITGGGCAPSGTPGREGPLEPTGPHTVCCMAP